jgi:DNA polymerase III sliding clamp (beta) subunit (PCNA family)
MQVIVDKNEFKKAVDTAKFSLSKVVLQEERSHLLCKVEDDKLSIIGTNNDLKCRVSITVVEKDQDEMSFTIDPKVIDKLISKIDTDQVRLEIDSEDLVVKIYTTQSGKSFTSFQSFPPDKMLTFSSELNDEDVVCEIPSDVLSNILKWSLNYMAPLKDEVRKYDFLILHDSIAYSANGSNKIGFYLSRLFKSFDNTKIRKSAIPSFVGTLSACDDESIRFFENEKEVGFSNAAGNIYFSFLKSAVDTPKIKKDMIKSEGPHVEVDKTSLMKCLDRLVITSKDLAATGIELTLSGVGSDAKLTMTMIGNLKCTETLSCVRVDDDNEDVTRTVSYKLFKTVLSSFSSDGLLQLFIDNQKPFFKLYKTGEEYDNKFISVGIGSYSRVVSA